jgi:hypothetical protein
MRIVVWRDRRQRQILSRGCRRKGDHRLQIQGCHRREVPKDLRITATLGEARQQRTKRNTRPANHGLASADFRVADDVLVIVESIHVYAELQDSIDNSVEPVGSFVN